MERFSDQQIVQSWAKNARPWIATIHAGAIESRRLVTDQAIIDAVRRQKPATGLDIGCGEGWLVRSLHDIRMSGIDVIPDLINRARQESSHDFRLMSYGELAEGQIGKRFDVGICNFSLLGKESVDDVFRAADAFLEPGGSLIVQTLHPLIACGVEQYEAPRDLWRLPYLREWSHEEIQQVFP